ncbi:MAG: hypothetical protein JO322_04545 [Candidatus Eremiobacteraeota bacterium]|nr:hypothetical protein [Candidatus Eremiobacteraeota bacterium]
MIVVPAILASALIAQQPVSPAPSSSPAPSLADQASWIAAHLPARYDENLAGTTNNIVARYSASGCKIIVALDFSWQFNSLGKSDRSAAYTVRGSVLSGHHFDASDNGGTIDFSIVSPASLHVADATEYLGTEQVTEGGFEFTFANETDAKAMLGAMTSFAQDCASHRT